MNRWLFYRLDKSPFKKKKVVDQIQRQLKGHCLGDMTGGYWGEEVEQDLMTLQDGRKRSKSPNSLLHHTVSRLFVKGL